MDKPKTPEAKRRANDKWDKENMTTLGCKVKKHDAEIFKKYAEGQGKKANTVLKDYVMDCVKSYNKSAD